MAAWKGESKDFSSGRAFRGGELSAGCASDNPGSQLPEDCSQVVSGTRDTAAPSLLPAVSRKAGGTGRHVANARVEGDGLGTGAPRRRLCKQPYHGQICSRPLQCGGQVRDERCTDAPCAQEVAAIFDPAACSGIAQTPLVNDALRSLYLGPSFAPAVASALTRPNAALKLDEIGEFIEVWSVVDFERGGFRSIDAGRVDFPPIPACPAKTWICLPPPESQAVFVSPTGGLVTGLVRSSCLKSSSCHRRAHRNSKDITRR